ncbi:MAG: translation initiation factor Sui1 [Candidatus Obscuribacterales bacterium]|nr:translation initiation factor Sui1 [Steroidobacteraceae bacterium]
MKRDDSSGGIVYSTDIGKRCPQCLRAVTACVCRGKSKPAHGNGVVRVSRETKGRAGKGVSVITGLPLSGESLEALATQLKKRCGTGGTVKEGAIEIQGDHRDVLVAELIKLGFQAKRAGG